MLFRISFVKVYIIITTNQDFRISVAKITQYRFKFTNKTINIIAVVIVFGWLVNVSDDYFVFQILVFDFQEQAIP